MGWWKADRTSEPLEGEVSSTSPSSNRHSPFTSTSSRQQSGTQPQPQSQSNDTSACPVDPKTRQLWLQTAQQNSRATASKEAPVEGRSLAQQQSPAAFRTFENAPREECSSERIDQPNIAVVTPHLQNSRPLSVNREVSSIPRAYPFSETPATNIPSNAEAETGHDKSSGNWIYPSESQFFNAVMRKSSQSTSAADLASSISSIIPIHNAVNERAWSMIRKWEADEPSNKTCGGPKLLRFEGKGAGAKSPRAIMKSWSGYSEPFDRHDWTVQRCDGTEVEYVIDFYQGRSPAGQVTGATQGAQASSMGGINFYLDVRPKLNSFEGCKMRLERFVGWK